jgi:hypothetical protein
MIELHKLNQDIGVRGLVPADHVTIAPANPNDAAIVKVIHRHGNARICGHPCCPTASAPGATQTLVAGRCSDSISVPRQAQSPSDCRPGLVNRPSLEDGPPSC